MSSLADLGVLPVDLDALIAESAKPLLVEFWAPCGTCRLMAPSMIKLRVEQGDVVEIVTLNVEEGPDAALTHNVLSLPTVIAFRGGAEVRRLNGMVSYANLLAETRALAAQ
jgi:thioredoxin-like negative regulator of GroEL